MISANGGLPAHRYTPQVTQRWPRGSEPASVACLAVGRSLVVAAPRPPFWVSRFLLPPLGALCLFFSSFLSLSAPPLSLAFSDFRPRVPRVFFSFFFGLPLFALRALLPVLLLPLGRWLLPLPPPLLCLAVFVAPARCLAFFFSSFLRPRCFRLFLVFDPGCPGPWRCVVFVLLGSP